MAALSGCLISAYSQRRIQWKQREREATKKAARLAGAARTLRRGSSDSIVKQPSFILLAADFPRELQIVFLFAPSREGAERRKAHPGCLPLRRTGAGFAKPARLTALHCGVYGRWDPSASPERQAVLPALTSPGDATEDSIRGSVVSQEAFSTRPPGPRLRIVGAGSPLSIHAKLRLQSAPRWMGIRSI